VEFSVSIPTETLFLKNASFPHFMVLKAQAVVDTACNTLCIPESVREQLDLDPVDMRPAEDGSERLVPYVGPIEVRLRDGVTFCGALVMGERVRLGRIPLTGLSTRG
jgi:hypothetical protein